MSAKLRLTLISFAVVVVAVLATSAVIEREVRAYLRARSEADLSADARATGALLRRLPDATPGELDAAVDDLARALGSRLTVIDAQGRVLADSELTPAAVASAESHAERPEVRAARTGSYGVADRFSNTLLADMLYVAVPAETAHTGVVVRAAMPLSEVDAVLSRARALVLLGGAAGIVIALLMSMLASRLFVAAARDVSELRRLEVMRKDFVANVSHELRTPISVIAANAETLMLGALEDKSRARQFVEAIANNAERLSRLIADLLDLSRIESGREKLVMERLPVERVVEKVNAALKVSVEGRGHALHVTVSPEMVVLADPRAVEQVVTNLLENSIKYTPPGGQLAVRARKDGRDVELVFEDDGPGIAPEHRARVFERFYRVDAGRSREAGGTGLGLAIVKHLVEAMGGRVRFEPNEPHGSRFVVRLPAA